MNHYDIIRRPRITEKSVYQQNEFGVYTFEVDRRASRDQIKEAVEGIFGVEVARVRTMNCAGKKRRVGRSVGRTSDWKKALITLAEGQHIEEL